MKITIFGLTISSSWGNGHATHYRALIRALSRKGHDVTFYEKDVEYYARRRDFAESDFCKLVLYESWNEVRSRALKEAAASDVVMTASYLPEGARINDEVLALAAPLAVFYDLDTPVTLAQLECGCEEYVRGGQLREFDLVLSWTGGAALAQLRTRFGAELARPLFGGVDPDVYVRTERAAEFLCELSYMGTYAPDRQQKVDALFLEPARRRAESSFLLAGTLYPREWQLPGNIKRFDHVAPSQHAALYSSSRLTLNITRDQMAISGYCPSGRLFEAAACGTPIISDWFEGLDMFFQPAREIVIANKAEDVLSALSMSDGELRRLARKARERTLDEHTGMHRAETLLRYFEEAHSRARYTDNEDFLEAAS